MKVECKTDELHAGPTSQVVALFEDHFRGQAGRLSGKGALIAEAVRSNASFEVIAWEDQLLLQYRGAIQAPQPAR
jgi:hypothetical protein